MIINVKYLNKNSIIAMWKDKSFFCIPNFLLNPILVVGYFDNLFLAGERDKFATPLSNFSTEVIES